MAGKIQSMVLSLPALTKWSGYFRAKKLGLRLQSGDYPLQKYFRMITRQSAYFVSVLLLLLTTTGFVRSQTVASRLQVAYANFAKDPQLRYASHSIYVMERQSGRLVFARNASQGLAPASTQKVVTAAAAFALLGPDFRYSNLITLDPLEENTGSWQLGMLASGDPSWGSPRYASTQAEFIFSQIAHSLKSKGIRKLAPSLVMWQQPGIDSLASQEGWILQDLGNYYGAPATRCIWRENQYDILLRSGKKLGDPVVVINKDDLPSEIESFRNKLSSAAAGTGDNAYIYPPLGTGSHLLKGTIPVNENRFSISGSVQDGDRYFGDQLLSTLKLEGFEIVEGNSSVIVRQPKTETAVLASLLSPAIDSLSYWFLRKSVNLYGEAFVKTIGEKKSGNWSTDEGLALMRRFWAAQGIDSNALRMQDGSGLSPQNRVTTEALAKVLWYAARQSWYADYLEGFPLYNGMKMKSGTISGVKGFCGYHRSKKDGKEYIFAILVNNYTGSSSSLVGKMYRVLDVMK